MEVTIRMLKLDWVSHQDVAFTISNVSGGGDED
jgi:hypothetical protein